MSAKWKYIPKETKDKILNDAVLTTPDIAAAKWKDAIGMSHMGVRNQITKNLKLNGLKPARATGKSGSASNPIVGLSDSPSGLSDDQREFIEDLKTGKKDIEDVSKYMLATWFENVLKNPGLVKSIDAFRAEMVKLKKQENKDRKNQAMILVSMMFNGQIPPAVCPNCGERLYDINPEKRNLSKEIVSIESGDVEE